jgi:hypothetical protein
VLDLHNHPFEAMGVARVSDVTPDHLRRIDGAASAAGVTVVAVTEHGGWEMGRRAAELAAELGDLATTILAGQEDWCFPLEVVEVELPSGRVFRFLAHPGAPGPFETVFDKVVDGLHGMEVDNITHRWHMHRSRLEAIAEEHRLVPMCSSDAHDLADLGRLTLPMDLHVLEAAVDEKPVQEWSLHAALGGRR